MKSLLILNLALISLFTNAFAASLPTKIVVRERTFEPVVVSVSKCQSPKTDFESYSESYKDDRLEFNATTGYTVKYCYVTESYKVKVTGPWYSWNKTEEEIQGSNVRIKKIVSVQKEFYSSQKSEILANSRPSLINAGISALYIKKVYNEVLNECNESREMKKEDAVNIQNTECAK